MVGFSFSLYLINHYPLLLVALSPIGRHVMLAVPKVDPLALLAVTVLRRMIFYFACYQVGRALGPSGIGWLEARAKRFGRFVRWLEALFERFSYGVVLVFAGPTVSALAGIAHMRIALFLALAGIGLTVRVLVMIEFAEWFREPIEWLLVLADEYWKPGTAVLVTGVLLYNWWRLRAARGARAAATADAQPSSGNTTA